MSPKQFCDNISTTDVQQAITAKIPTLTILLAAESNEFLIGWTTTGALSLYVHRVFAELLLIPHAEMDSYWIGWHKHCFTWKIFGKVRVIIKYSDYAICCNDTT